jgi:30S ribosomal protein S31
MGRGDRRTKRGKIWRQTYGKSRPKHANIPGPEGAAKPAAAVKAPKKAPPAAKPAKKTPAK